MVFWILEGYRKLYEVRPTSPTLRLHPFADMSGTILPDAGSDRRCAGLQRGSGLARRGQRCGDRRYSDRSSQ